MEQSVRFAVPDRSKVGSLPLGRGDERLARLVGTGHDRAFAMLFERYHRPLYRYCRSLVRNDEDAQDALQSTMTRALVALRSGQRDAPLRPWLYRIAHNESISLLRRRPATDELGDAVACTSLSPEEDVAQRERLATLVADLQELPERQRGALVMRELAGLAHTEIATTLGISVGAAKQTIFEARCGLAEFTEGRTMACDDVRRAISDGDGRGLRGRRIRAHLRACATCSMFAAAIPSRERDLAALAPPLAPLAAAGLMTQLLGTGTPHAAGGSGVAVAAAGKSVSVALAAKAAVGIAIVATAAAVLAPAKHTVKPAATSTTRSAPWVGGSRRAAAPRRSVSSHATTTVRPGHRAHTARHHTRRPTQSLTPAVTTTAPAATTTIAPAPHTPTVAAAHEAPQILVGPDASRTRNASSHRRVAPHLVATQPRRHLGGGSTHPKPLPTPHQTGATPPVSAPVRALPGRKSTPSAAAPTGPTTNSHTTRP
jgi:RNA polymerase sigma factor (sigma-70 family)